MADVEVRRWRPDRPVRRRTWWVLLDVAVAYISAVISVGPSDYTASVTEGPVVVRVAAAVWFMAIALRRFAPATALWAGALATVATVAAHQPVTNLSLPSALALALVAQMRPPRPSPRNAPASPANCMTRSGTR